jgi:C_GCAxxG_C_C family probable redox protein
VNSSVNRIDAASQLHTRGANCAQAVVCVFAEGLGLDKETAMRAATGFGGGMGRLAETCGAVTGAFMTLGLARGMRSPEEAATKESTYALVREFARRFSEKNGSLACRDLLEADIGTADGMKRAREANLFAVRCTGYIRDAVGILEEMLRE